MLRVMISEGASVVAAVHAVEAAIMDHQVSIGGAAPIFVCQAFPFAVPGYKGDPWGPHYPRVFDVQRVAAKEFGISVEVDAAA